MVPAVDRHDHVGDQDSGYTKVMKAALRIAYVYFDDGRDTNEDTLEYIIEDETSEAYSSPGWVWYPKRQTTKHMSLATMQLLNSLFFRGNNDKLRRVSTDKAHFANIKELSR